MNSLSAALYSRNNRCLVHTLSEHNFLAVNFRKHYLNSASQETHRLCIGLKTRGTLFVLIEGNV